MAGPDIFLSYNREDADAARRFAEAFARDGFDVWWDVALRSGETYDEVTENALRSAGAVVVLWSPRSVVSRWVRAEATLADRNKTLVPAMIEPCERPIMFELTQTAELCHWQGDPTDSAWQSFLKDVRGLVDRARATQADAGDAPQAEAPADLAIPALAILPFTNRSGETGDDAFADGMVEDLIAALSANSTLRILSASATRRFRDAAIDLPKLAAELDARYVLEGNVRRIGETLRVTAQLVDPATGTILWNRRFEGAVANLAALQEDLALDVAGHLGVQLVHAELERVLAKPADITAWELLMRAGSFSLGQTPEGLHAALALTRKATELAPNFAMARSLRGLNAALNYWQGAAPDPAAMIAEARENTELAIELARHNPMALNNAAMALCLTGAWKEGLRMAERAYQANPNLEIGRQAMAMACIYHKRADEAIEHLDACLLLAPGSPSSHIRHIQKAGAHYIAGRFYKAIQSTEQCLALQPSFAFALKDMAIYLEALGQREEAIEALAEFRAHWPDISLEMVEQFHKRSLLPPDVAAEMQETFAAVWHAAANETA